MSTSATLRLVAAAPALGAVGSALVGIILAVAGGVPGAGIILFVIVLIAGTATTSVAAGLTILGRFTTRRSRARRAWDLIWSVLGPLIAWVATYGTLLRAQTQWDPVVFVLTLTIVTGTAFFLALSIRPRARLDDIYWTETVTF